MSRVKMGFVGAGFIAQFQVQALKQVRGIDLVGIVSPNRAQALVDEVNALGLRPCERYETVEALCEACDVVCIFAPNYLREEHVQAVVNAQKNGANLKGVVCEKPLARTVDGARRLVALADEVDLKTFYFENQLFMKPITIQRKQLAPQQEAMGPLAIVRSAEEHAGPHEPWFWDPVQQGGGVLSDMGCHSIAVAWYALTPLGKPLNFLEPISVSCELALLKWGLPKWRKDLKDRMGVDYAKTPAEDFATGVVTFRNPETGQHVKAQFTNSWMFDKQGLRIFMDGMGPGYAFEVDSLKSPMNVFIGDAAADAVADAETALEKSTASRGLLVVEPNEADLYGYADEMEEVRDCILQDKAPLADWNYGVEIVRLCAAAYMAGERKTTIDLTDPAINEELETYVSLIAQGKGLEVLHVPE